ncbi:MAG: insulinase family protein [Acidobacteria bacterium]|nr:insulinase family protein [Acidobacteriota bacterium]
MMRVNPTPPALLLHRLPGRRTVSAGVWLLHGAAHDPAPRAGATHLVEHLTLRRCGGRDRTELARLVDRLGGSVDAWTGAEAMGLSIETTSDALPEALDLLLDATLDPTFDADDVALEKRVALAEMELVRSDPEDRVEEALLTAAWGDHPLARPIIGSEQTVRRLTPTALRRHHAALLRPGGVLAAVVGDVDPAAVSRRLGRLPLAAPIEPLPLPPLRWMGGAVNLEWTAGDQVYARLAFPTEGFAAPGREITAVLNRTLGVGASSRLFQRLREDAGLTYDIFSSLVLRRQGGFLEVGWTSSADVFSESWRLVRDELAAFPDGLTDEDVEVAVEATVRGLLMDAEEPSSRCGLEAAEVLELGRPFDLERVIGEIRTVSPPAVREAARTVLRPERTASAVCGPQGVTEQVA